MARIYKASSKQGQQLLRRARVNEGFSLEEVYGKCSAIKKQEWEKCLDKCERMMGEDFHICSHNTFQFSVAWKADGAYYIETASNSYIVLLDW